MNRRISPTENLLSDEPESKKKTKKKKIRNYSFQESKRLPADKMTVVNGIKVPSMPGSCYHAIICALAFNKDKFCSWDKIIELTGKNMKMYGGEENWQKFLKKSGKSPEVRIKDNAHTLTRTGKDCYGYRLHELGMCIYYFKDGAMLVTGGYLVKNEGRYDVIFVDGKTLQTRYRGTTMTHKEYKKFLEKGLIDITGKILNVEGVKKARTQGTSAYKESSDEMHVCIVLGESFDQHTANRLEGIGLKVEQGLDNELIGTVSKANLEALKQDVDVVEVEVSGE